MKTKKLFFTAALALSGLFGSLATLSAQEVIDLTTLETFTEKAPGKVRFYAPSLWSNMYISAGAGTQTFFAEHLDDTRFTLAIDAALGKWITPTMGLRLNVLGGELENNWQPDDKIYRLKYFGIYGDFMWNLTNAVMGYDATRVINIIPFAGIGYNYVFHNNMGKKGYAFPISGGVKFNFRLSSYFDIFAEARSNILGDYYNKIVTGSQVESIMSVVGGITVKLGKDNFVAYNAYADQAVIAVLNKKVNRMRTQLEDCMERECPPCPEVVVAEEVTVVEPVCNKDLTAVVHFDINSSKVTSNEMINVYNIAEWMKANPNCSVTIVGYADKDTGSTAYNMKLSQHRAEAVVKILTDKYMIDSSRIQMSAKGSDEQYYPNHNDWNRVVVFYGKSQM